MVANERHLIAEQHQRNMQQMLQAQQTPYITPYWESMRNMYRANNMYADLRNPASPLPDSARTIKEKCIALMDDTWGKIEQPAQTSGFNPYTYSVASATATNYSGIFGQGAIQNVVSWNTKP